VEPAATPAERSVAFPSGNLPPVSLPTAAEALAEARRQSEAATADATDAGTRSGMPFNPEVEAGQRPSGAPPARREPPASSDEPPEAVPPVE
jgi:hypothetical protein